MIQESLRLKYEPASEPLHISVKWLFLNGDQGAGEVGGAAAHRQVTEHVLGRGVIRELAK